MQKNKANVFVTTFIILFISLTILNYVYAQNNEIVDDWKVTITNDAKELNYTHEIKFKVEKNNDIVPEKMAPGMKAIAEIELNLEKVEGFAYIEVKIEDSKLNNVFKLNTKLDENSILTSEIIKIEAGSTKIIILELIWNENNMKDANIGTNVEIIEVPIQVKVLQDI